MCVLVLNTHTIRRSYFFAVQSVLKKTARAPPERVLMLAFVLSKPSIPKCQYIIHRQSNSISHVLKTVVGEAMLMVMMMMMTFYEVPAFCYTSFIPRSGSFIIIYSCTSVLQALFQFCYNRRRPQLPFFLKFIFFYFFFYFLFFYFSILCFFFCFIVFRFAVAVFF